MSLFDLKFKRLSTHEIYFSDIDYIKPQIPQYYIESQKRWVDNPDHPDYQDAILVAQVDRTIKTFDYILETAIDFDLTYLNNPVWKKEYKKLKYLGDINNVSEKLCFIKYMIQPSYSILDEICLTENRIVSIIKLLNVTRNLENIIGYELRNSIETNINYDKIIVGDYQISHPLDEYTACIKSNMSYEKWLNNEYSLNIMANTIAMFRMNRIIEIHSEDAMQIESEKKSKAKS